MQKEIANKPAVMAAQRTLLEHRYNLTPKLDPQAKMPRGKPLVVGPTARLPQNLTWERLAAMPAEEIKTRDIFPYPSLPHPLQSNGGQVFPPMQIQMFPRLQRFDVDFDLPEAFLLNSLQQFFFRAGPSWATSPAVKSSPSTTTTGCSKIF